MASRAPQVTIPKFNWDSIDKQYTNWLRSKTEAKNLLNSVYKKCDEAKKVAILLNWMAGDAVTMLELFDDAGKDKEKLADVLELFENSFKPTSNIHLARHELASIYSNSKGIRCQTDFMMRLRDQAKHCNFTNADEWVKFLFIEHNNNEQVKTELLRNAKNDTDLKGFLDIARGVEGLELAEKQSKGESFNVNAVQRGRSRDRRQGKCNKSHGRDTSGQRGASQNRKYCNFCGGSHPPRQCPVWGKECHVCGTRNHFAKMCKSGAKRAAGKGQGKSSKRINEQYID